ncbi:signal peptidase II [Vampirovibrio sp.]|uniref:signal peptidase II n=1 Tax=Vampirovibrio sp. TaxID=2717857 RepID=UPI0035948CBD
MKHPSRWMLLAWMLSFTLLDQGSKWLAKAYLPSSGSVPIIPGFFQLTLAFNTGAAFSLFKNQPQLLSVFTSLLFGVLLIYALLRTHFAKGERLAMALILGGALGNLIDRLTTGRVTDYFDWVAIHYPVFNVADSFIFMGVVLMITILVKNPTPVPATQPIETHEPPSNA